MSKLKIDSNLFKTLAPKSNRSTFFQPGSEINILQVNEENLVEYAGEQVPTLHIEANGLKRDVPAPAILGAVVTRDGIIHNKDKGDLECVDFIGNTLYDYLADKFGEGNDIELPDSLKVIKRINKGVEKSFTEGKKEIYNESNLVEDGKTYDEVFKDLQFLPTIYKSRMGVFNTGKAYLLEAID